MYIGFRTVRFQASSGGLGMGRLQTREDSCVPHTGSSAPRVDLLMCHEGLRNVSSHMKIQVQSSNLLSKLPEPTSTLHRLSKDDHRRAGSQGQPLLLLGLGHFNDSLSATVC